MVAKMTIDMASEVAVEVAVDTAYDVVLVDSDSMGLLTWLLTGLLESVVTIGGFVNKIL